VSGRDHAGRRSRLAAVLCVLAIAAAIRAVNFLSFKDTPLPYLHYWSETDIAFYHGWARKILAGDLLSVDDVRPYHSWHVNVAREAHRLLGADTPLDHDTVRRYWDRWLGGPATFYQDPLYAYFLAAVYRVAGVEPRAAAFIQTLCGLGIVWLVFLIAERLFDRRVAILAGLGAAAYGPLLYYEMKLYRTLLISGTGLLMLYAATCLLDAVTDDRARRPVLPAVLAGLATGLAIATHASAMLFAALVVLGLLAAIRRSPRRGDATLIGYTVGSLIVLTPIGARNVSVGAPVWTLNATGPITFINHNAVDYDPRFGDHASKHAAAILIRSEGGALASARETIRTHPSLQSWVRQVGGKLASMLHWYEMPGNTTYDFHRLQRPAALRFTLEFAPVAALGLIGLVLARRRDAGYALTVGYLTCGVLTIAVFFHLSRFRFPLAVALIPFAAFAVDRLRRLLREGRQARAGLMTLSALALMLWLWRPLPPGLPRMRTADYAVTNLIARHLAHERAESGDLDTALGILGRQLRTEPEQLRMVEPARPSSELSFQNAAIAGSFAELHRDYGDLLARAGRDGEAVQGRRRAQILSVIAEQYEKKTAARP
jgi:4-amino-4-deoxy-L-arabinose transferase-like glycosyltransferase